jgi:opacity protein-like surface antigen
MSETSRSLEKHEHGGPGVMSAIARRTRTRGAAARRFATFLSGLAGVMAFNVIIGVFGLIPRTVRIPDSNRWLLGAGVGYHVTESLVVDFAYLHILFDGGTVNETAQVPGAPNI